MRWLHTIASHLAWTAAMSRFSVRATHFSTARICTSTTDSLHRFPTEVIPGVASVMGAAARLGTPLVRRDTEFTDTSWHSLRK